MEKLPHDKCQCGSSKTLLRCIDCLGGGISCRICCLKNHKYLPFHRLQKWNGEFFAKTSLYAQGHVVYLGHGGNPCPKNSSAFSEHNHAFMERFHSTQDEDEDIDGEADGGAIVDEDVVIMVHTTGVYHHVVNWCKCVPQTEQHLELLRLHLFPVTITRTRTVFSFDVLDYYYVDTMECSTAANSFFKKLCRLTDSVFPQTVPVFLPSLLCFSCPY